MNLNDPMKMIKTLILLSLSALCLVSCNTVSGLGKDLTSAASVVSDTAQRKFTPQSTQQTYQNY